jgi:hypothetical protein
MLVGEQAHILQAVEGVTDERTAREFEKMLTQNDRLFRKRRAWWIVR